MDWFQESVDRQMGRVPTVKEILHTADGITDKPMHTLDRDGIRDRIAEVLRQHRCRDWHYEDEGGSMQLLDVLAQNANDETVSSAVEEIDDLAADIVDAIFGG